MEVRSQKRPLRVREVRMATSGSFSLRTHSYFAGTAVLQRPLGSGFGGRMLPASVTRSEWGTHFAATVANENKILVAGRVTGTNQGFGLSCGWQSCLSEWALGWANPLVRAGSPWTRSTPSVRILGYRKGRRGRRPRTRGSALPVQAAAHFRRLSVAIPTYRSVMPRV